LDLYQNYQTLEDRTKRNKVILGILTYQGITSGELQQLEVKHVKLKEGRIYIPAYGKSNNRLLDLQAAQLLELQEYILLVRPRMLENIKACRPGRKPDEINPLIYERLFFSENGSACIKNSLINLFRAIKKTHPEITNAKIIRSSVLVEWLKTQDIRIVQHKAGHRYVSSTERYTVYNLEELKDALKKYHPLK
jgi:integrase/recombinase XerD